MGPSHNSFGGSRNFCLLISCNMRALLYAGRFESFVTKHVLRFFLIKTPLELICYSAVFIKYWAGLNTTSDQEALRNGAEAIVAVAMEVHNTNLVLAVGGESLPPSFFVCSTLWWRFARWCFVVVPL
jgi:hypothetical protein